jgi:hypothetical protein
MAITYRAFDPNTDMSGLHEMHNHIYPERTLTLEELLEFERVTSPKVIRKRMVAIHDGRMVGFATASYTPGDPVGAAGAEIDHLGAGRCVVRFAFR